jgi:PAT family beta-lactamase induction signal transducer AmpG
MADKPASRNPWAFVPSLYFGEGLPYILINTVSVIIYKKMGVDNASIAFWTSWLYLPWVIKMLWGPVVDINSTKRNWILATQAAMAVCMLFTAWSLTTTAFFFLSLAAFVVGAFISATYDIATDGFYRLSMIFGSGLLVYLAGTFELATGNISLSWTLVMGSAGGIFAMLFVYHYVLLPFPKEDERRETRDETHGASFREIITAYFQQEKIGVLVAFILLYRLGEAMLLKLVSPFLLDGRSAGGLGLTTSQLGLVYGTVGILSLVIGGVLGGWLIARFGLRRCVWPLVIAMHLPDLFFVYMSWQQPSLNLVYPLVALEQFGYGMGFTVFTVYLMYSAEGKYKTSHYAISTGIMALGMMLPGFLSGWLQQQVGYTTFFIIVCFLTIPGMLTIPFLPKRERRE